MNIFEQILLKFRVDNSAVNPGLDDFGRRVEHAAGRAHSSFTKAHSSARAFRELLHEIRHESPILGLALEAMVHPAIVGFAAALIVLKTVHEKLKEFNAEMDKVGDKNAKAFGDIQKSTMEAAEEINKLNREIAHWEEHRVAQAVKLNQELHDQLRTMTSQQQLVEKEANVKKSQEHQVIQAREAAGLMTKEAAQKKAFEIDARYAKEEHARNIKNARAEFDVKAKALEDAAALEATIAQRVEDARVNATAQGRAIRLKELPKNISKFETSIEENKAAILAKQNQINSVGLGDFLLQHVPITPGVTLDFKKVMDAFKEKDIDKLQAEIRQYERSINRARNALQAAQATDEEAKQNLKDQQKDYDAAHEAFKTLTDSVEDARVKLVQFGQTPTQNPNLPRLSDPNAEFRPSLEQVATIQQKVWDPRFRTWRLIPGPNQAFAQEFFRLKESAIGNIAFGNIDFGKAQAARAREIRDRLNEAGILQRSPEEYLEELVTLAKGVGIKIDPAMGK